MTSTDHIHSSIPDERTYAQAVARLRAYYPDGASGFFGPGSMTWKIYREPGLLIAGYQALHLQVAHPAVAAGVKLHSNFQKDYLGRAHRTFLSMASLYFGSCDLAMRTAARIHSMHYRIQGSYIDQQGNSQDFCANQPEHLRWILATLVHSSMRAYESLLSPLTTKEKEQFICESGVLACLMGIPDGFFPDSLEEFYAYYYTTSDQLWVGPDARALSKDILVGPFPPLRGISRLLTTGFLPQRLNTAFHLSANEKGFSRLMTCIRFVYRLIPPSLRYAPPYYQASYRSERSTGQRSNFLSRTFHWLGKYLSTPFLLKEPS